MSGLQKIPHDATKYRMNPVELVNIVNRQRIGNGIIQGSVSKVSPTMTANNAPSPYIISADAAYTGYEPYKAFDNNSGTAWNHGSAFPGWLTIDFGLSVYAVDRYDVFCGGTYMTAWTFEGSNNNSTWTALDTRSGQNTSTLQSYTFTNATAYRYYRMSCTSMNGGWGYITQLDLYAAAKVSPTMTANNAPSPYVVSSESDYSASYPAWKVMDGVTNADSGMWSSANNTISNPPWWKIDFGSTVLVNGYKLMGYYTNSTYPTAWTIHGSNDNSNWTQLDSRTSQTLPSGVLSSLYSFSNLISYRYYKIIVTAVYGSYTRAVIGELELYGNITIYNNYIGA